ncbi:invasion associated locus B family protein [Wolbachia endosymbiont of Chironomus riparius]|uniref:invasion associated locus B family protein n=1 Tax=Wolbachia endosymbiont of Chironomus riparius TaxID=2883238 RepID=UPI0020A1CACC|nr:invasion associated locus B family protein [Wolbachia endosymbiont of Chironomus riparius]
MRSFFIILFFSTSVFASISDVKLREKYKDWIVYTALEDGENICYVVSYPKKKSENYITDRKSYVMVSYVDEKLDEVSVTSGFKYDKEPIILNIDSKIKYKLSIIEGNLAWAESTKVDQELILKMKQGLSMVVSGKKQAIKVDDTYSLLGFQSAYRKMHDLCNKK